MDAKRIESTDRFSEDDFEKFLDETEEDIVIWGCIHKPYEIVKKIDPIMFRAGYLDWANNEDNENPAWECDNCGVGYDDEEEAEHCCMYHCKEDDTWYNTKEEARGHREICDEDE